MEFNLFQNSASNKLKDLMEICKHLPGVFKDFEKATKELNILFAITVRSNEFRQSTDEKLWGDIKKLLKKMNGWLSVYESEITELEKKNETITNKINIYDELKNLSEDKKIKKEKEFNERVETIKTTYETTFNEDSTFKSKFDDRVKNIKESKKGDSKNFNLITEHLERDLKELKDEAKTNDETLLNNRNLLTMAVLINIFNNSFADFTMRRRFRKFP
jgi:hypothetical protein